MTIREQHIELNQSLQKIAANKTRKFLSEELDWVLNKIQNRFIQSKLRPRRGGGFSFDELDLDAIRPVLVQTKLPAYIDPARLNRYKVFLPTDYSYLIADYSFVDNAECRATKLTPEAKSIYITWLKKLNTAKVSAPFYETAQMTIDGTHIINIPSELPYTNKYVGYQSKDDVSFLYPWIIHTFNQELAPTIQVGSERYADKYKPNQIVIVSDRALAATTLSYDGISTTLKTEDVINYTQYGESVHNVIVQNRLETSEDTQKLVGTPFYAPSINSPISELINQTLYIYGDNSFTVSNCGITYVRKLRPVSLALGSDCELSEEFHQTICDLAVQYIKGRLENAPAEQLVEKDNETRVKL